MREHDLRARAAITWGAAPGRLSAVRTSAERGREGRRDSLLTKEQEPPTALLGSEVM